MQFHRLKRREFITLLGSAATWPVPARTQQPGAKIARIGFLRATTPHERQFNAFRDGLRALSYVDGQNIIIEQRYALGNLESRFRSNSAITRVPEIVASFAGR